VGVNEVVFLNFVKSRKRIAIAGVAALVTLLCAVPSVYSANKLNDKKIVKDLDYGVALFYFYQDKFFEAARSIMVADELNRMTQQKEDGTVLLGGIYLQYGLHQDAESLFSHLIDKNAPPEVRDQIWFNIGKLRYQKGLQDDAIRALEQIQGSLDSRTLSESHLLLANMLMGRGEYTQASKLLQQLPRNSIDATFAEYNLGIALFRSGRQIEGSELLAKVGRLTSSDPELLALRDKANLAMGYALLGEEESARARAFFQQVRLNGPFSNKALLGFGWSHAMQKDFESALSSWLELRSRKKTDASVYESLLAVGYALEQLKAFPQAMQSYLEAIELFKQEVARLDSAISEVRTGRLMNYLVVQALGGDTSDVSEEDLLKDVPEFRFITGIVAGHKFNDVIKTLVDLTMLKSLLRRWGDSLPIFDDMLRLRRQAYEERLPKLMPEKGVYKIASIKDERNLYQEEYKRIVFENDLYAVASGKEKKLLERLGKVEESLKGVARKMDANQYGNFEYKYNLFKGLMEWDISTTFNERIWNLKKGLNQLDKEIVKTEKTQERLQNAKSRAPRGFEGYGRQIDGYKKKISSLQVRIDEAYELQKKQVQDIIVDELSWLRERLNEYMDQAQFSLAQLQDRASQ